MARSPRIEFEGAAYHVMARGNRRESIVFDRGDRALFWETFGDVCAMTGWEVYAVVLMSAHYNAIFRTPAANLVDGMKWFQNAYTRRLKSLGANPNDRSSAMGQDRREKDGERIIAAAQRHYGVALNELRAKAYGDHRRASVAWRLARETTLPQSWIAERLDLKTPSNVSRIVGRFSKAPNRSLPKAVREWKTLKIID